MFGLPDLINRFSPCSNLGSSTGAPVEMMRSTKVKLTDSERLEFIALAQDTYAPELWTEEDLPILRGAKEKVEKEQQEEAALRRKLPAQGKRRKRTPSAKH